MDIRIYGLVDPRDNIIRYVGKTKNELRKRLYRHLHDTPKHNTYKHNWIMSLKTIGIKPLIVELEICNETNWIEREQFWISQFENLTNLTAGGEGINFFTDTVLEKISESLKNKWEDPDYIKKISDKRIEYWSNPENRENQANKIKGKKKTKEDIEGIIKRNIDRKNDPVYVEKMKNLAKKRWEDPEFRKKWPKHYKKKGE